MYATAVNDAVPPAEAIVSSGAFLTNNAKCGGTDSVPLFPEPLVTDPSKVKTMSVLTNDDYWVLFLQSLKDSDEFGMMKIKSMEGERKKCIDWLRSKGKSQKDYRAFFKNWLRRKMEQEGNSRTNNGMVF